VVLENGILSGPATRPKTPLAVENSVGKLAAPEMRRQMPARERELGELPSPIWSLLDRKVGQGLDVFTHPRFYFVEHFVVHFVETSLKHFPPEEVSKFEV
jgi:hypothetical protein